MKQAEADGKAPAGASERMKFYEDNVLNRDALERIFAENDIYGVIHFAGFKAVGESVEKPLEYYYNNITNTLILCDVMRKHGCKRIVFSSSATVYGEPDSVPLSETAEKKPATNPYGWTKWMIEQILMDVHTADPEWDVVLLRYFNPIGAHESGLIGEDPKGIPNNLVPYVAQVAIGKMKAVRVFGNDYPTPDGTGVRDYIHVVDLARGHVAALNWMDGKTGVEVVNLGTGKGSSVLDVVAAFSRACGRELPGRYSAAPRWRCCGKLRRPAEGQRRVRLGCGIRPRSHVCRFVALAVDEPEWVRRLNDAPLYLTGSYGARRK